MNVPPAVRDPDNYRFCELILHLPPDWPIQWEEFSKPENLWPMTVLKQSACLPHENESWVWFGHTLCNGEIPSVYAPNTQLCAAMLCPSFQLHPEFQSAEFGGGRILSFLSLAFLYREELAYVQSHGAQTFLSEVRMSGLGPLDFLQLDKNRNNVCA